jgi:hypothetical protein
MRSHLYPLPLNRPGHLSEASGEMKRKKAKATPAAAPRRIVRRYRSMGIFESRASLLRRLLQDARLERCVQMVP